jgi:hypothetical protein
MTFAWSNSAKRRLGDTWHELCRDDVSNIGTKVKVAAAGQKPASTHRIGPQRRYARDNRGARAGICLFNGG